jgi:ferritin-like metal-binding protein YciE
MTQQQREATLIRTLQDAHALEGRVGAQIDGLLETVTDADIRADLERHLRETGRHERLLAERLNALGRKPSGMKEVSALASAVAKSMSSSARRDRGRDGRDLYATVQMEIAGYELLERLATAIGDETTAEIARDNRAEDVAIAEALSHHWDRFAELSLEDAEVAPSP